MLFVCDCTTDDGDAIMMMMHDDDDIDKDYDDKEHDVR